MQVSISNYGATIVSWITPDRNGQKRNIVLGFDSLSGYLAPPPYFGATIGRYGNRIANARFKIGTKQYTLAANNGKNHLHGGIKGFDKVVWNTDAMIGLIPKENRIYLYQQRRRGRVSREFKSACDL